MIDRCHKCRRPAAFTMNGELICPRCAAAVWMSHMDAEEEPDYEPFPFRCCGNCEHGFVEPPTCCCVWPQRAFDVGAIKDDGEFVVDLTNPTEVRQLACCPRWKKFEMPEIKAEGEST